MGDILKIFYMGLPSLGIKLKGIIAIRYKLFWQNHDTAQCEWTFYNCINSYKVISKAGNSTFKVISSKLDTL